MSRTLQVVVDCANPDGLAKFWAEALGYTVQPPPPGHDSWPDFLASMGVPESQWGAASAIIDPDGNRPRIFFQKVPEPKQGKNRVHLDVQLGRGAPEAAVETEVARLQVLGATRVRECAELGESWVVMQDPEGNEFCVS